MKALSILLIEDEIETAKIITDVLQADGCIIEVHHHGAAGIRAAGIGNHDVIILDRTLPDVDGITVLTRLRSAGVATPILILSALARAENRTEGLTLGADDYLGKPFEPHELIARVRALHRRTGNVLPTTVLIYADLELHVKARTAHRQGQHLALSPKEFELLKFMMENAGEIVTRDMLLAKVWNLSFDPQTNVVDVNVGRLRHRLEAGFDSSILETVRGIGYRLTPPTDKSGAALSAAR